MKRSLVCLVGAAVLLLLAGGEARGGRALASMPGGDGAGDVNLIVRQVRVTPVRAHVGDPIRIDAVVEDHGEGRGTVVMRVYADGKQVAHRLFTYDDMDGPNALYRESFVWDTGGVRPGAYRIRAEVFDWKDSSPFDNEMTVAEPVTLMPAGEPFPAGEAEGGEAVAVDPRWHPDSRRSKETGARNSPTAPGIERETASGRTR